MKVYLRKIDTSLLRGMIEDYKKALKIVNVFCLFCRCIQDLKKIDNPECMIISFGNQSRLREIQLFR